jgi:CelD/BcsL family acetyltransferase involved in cellulose biosynthesis
MTDVREINDPQRLDEYRSAWSDLLDQTPAASFFQSLDWLEVYWRHFGAGQKLRVLVVSSAGRTIGILPLVVQRERTRVGTIRVLTYPLHDWGSFYGPIGPEPGATLSAGLEYVVRGRRDWDVLELRWVAPGEKGTGPICAKHPSGGHQPKAGRGKLDLSPFPTPSEPQRAMQAAGLQAYETVWDRAAVVDLGGTWDDYVASRPAKWRNNYRRLERRVQEQGQLDYFRYRPAGLAHGDCDPRWDLYDACEELARRSWQGDSTTGTTLSHESIRPYLREVHASAARAGAVDLNLLLLNGRPAAFAYNYCWRGYVFGVRAGYDADVSHEGAGGLLLAWAIRDSFRRGDRLYDLGVGYLRGKRYLATRIVPIYRYSHFHPKAVRAQLLRVKRWIQTKAVAPALSGEAETE